MVCFFDQLNLFSRVGLAACTVKCRRLGSTRGDSVHAQKIFYAKNHPSCNQRFNAKGGRIQEEMAASMTVKSATRVAQGHKMFGGLRLTLMLHAHSLLESTLERLTRKSKAY